jgi:hypothetical protein
MFALSQSMMNSQGEEHCAILCNASHLPDMQVGGFVEGEDEEGVKDGNGMKERLGGETNCGSQLSLACPQQLRQHIVIIY